MVLGVQIRKATEDDIPWLIPELKKFSTFFNTKHEIFGGESHVTMGLVGIIRHHVLFIATLGDAGPIGFIGGIVTPHLFNPKIKVLAETFWWVDESHRWTKAGLKLLNAFVEYGKENTNWITFSLENHSPVNERALLKRGFKLHERNYLCEI